MNREIKFRVRHKENKYFINAFTKNFAFALAEYITASLTFDKTHFEESFTIQQFTGLLDKNGKEIYEGDIVRYESPISHDNEYYHDLLTSEVFWRIDRWRIRYAADSYNWRKMEVIGNIFENPELIKNEKQ